MSARKLFVVLLVVLIATLGAFHVPVARAVTALGTATWTSMSKLDVPTSAFYGTWWYTAYFVETVPDPSNYAGNGAKWTGTVTVDGVAATTGYPAILPRPWSTSPQHVGGASISFGWPSQLTGVHHLVINGVVSNNTTDSWTGTAYVSCDYTGVLSTQEFLPLSLTLSGSTTANVGESVTWTAAASGGTTPYTYAWFIWPVTDASGAPVQWIPSPVPDGQSVSQAITAATAETMAVMCVVKDATGANVQAEGRVVFGAAVYHAYTITLQHTSLGLLVYLQRDMQNYPADKWTVDTVQAPTGYSYLAPSGGYWIFSGNMDNQTYYDFHVHCDGKDMHIVGDMPPLGASTHQDYDTDGNPEDGSAWNSEKPTWGAWLDNILRKLFQPLYDFFALLTALITALVSIFNAVVVIAGLVLVIMGALVGEVFKILGVWASVWFVAPEGYHALASWLGPLLANGSHWLSGAAFAAAVDKYLGAVWSAVYPNALFQLLSWAYAAWVLLRALLWKKPDVSSHWGNEVVD